MSDNEVVEFTDVDIMFDDDIEFCRRAELRVILRPAIKVNLVKSAGINRRFAFTHQLRPSSERSHHHRHRLPLTRFSDDASDDR